MDTLVSVVVTSYNHAEYLPKRFETLLNQIYKNIEVIVIDDHSPDNSAEVIKNYKDFKAVLLEENRGYANASNLGVEMSSGKYIMFAECDDFNEPTHIEKLVSILDKYENVGVSYVKSNMVDENGISFGDDYSVREKKFREMCKNSTLIKKEDMQKFLLQSCVVPNMSAAMFRKEIFLNMGGLSKEYKLCADWNLWNRFAKVTDFYYVNEALNHFRFHETTARSKVAINVQILEIFKLLYESIQDMNLSLLDKLKFNINICDIWLSYITKSPILFLKKFSKIFLEASKYDKTIFIYLIISFVKKVIRFILRKIGVIKTYASK